jgi:hypothetical protein
MKTIASITAAVIFATSSGLHAGDFNAAIGNFDYSDKGKKLGNA